MLIILEGVDRCGKSTLGEYLSKELGWPLYHHTKPPAHPMDYFMESMVKVRGRDNAIFDRFHWSQLAYGPVFRDQLGLSDLQVQVLDQWCMDRPTITIYLQDSIDNIQSRWSDDEMYPPDNIAKLQWHYDEIMEKTPLTYRKGRLPQLLDANGNPTLSTTSMLYAIRTGVTEGMCQ